MREDGSGYIRFHLPSSFKIKIIIISISIILGKTKNRTKHYP